jgi:hypothetical protein
MTMFCWESADAPDCKKLYVEGNQRPEHISLFITYSGDPRYGGDVIASPWVHLTYDQALELGQAILEIQEAE